MNEPNRDRPRPIDRWWVQLLVSLWIIAIIVIYFRLQVLRVFELTGIRP